MAVCPQEVVQSVVTIPNEAEVTSSNPPPFLCGHFKKIKMYGSVDIYKREFGLQYNS